MDGDECIGTIVCKLDRHRETYRGYIAMLAVHKDHRHKGLGASTLGHDWARPLICVCAEQG
jgi:peptide alpha-N-acetyltransferase